MASGKNRTVYVCSECGAETHNWGGQCRSCGAWNTLKEFNADLKSEVKDLPASKPKKLAELDEIDEVRFSTGISELDRVLGGGAVEGSLILVGGAPGIGKSTLLLQMCGNTLGKTVLYITGEESEKQLKLRAERLKITNPNLYVLSETIMENILVNIDRINPDIVIIDSIQTTSTSDNSSSPGSLAQIRECTMKLLRATKAARFTTFVVGHITKEGTIAGPKILEHMVDCVLYFEGDNNTSFRILRAAKNRFGSTNEIGVFEMLESGLECVDNPSEMLLSGRPANSSGTCVCCVIEGSRPILAEVQALVSPTSYNASRRCNGFDYNRLAMLLAVLEKRCGLQVSGCDSFVNVVGGLSLDDTSADLAVILSLASSFFDRPLGEDVTAIGEVGLSGEIRSVSMINQRLSEISRLGFKRCIIPSHIRYEIKSSSGLELIPAANIQQAIKATLGAGR